jgi:hypothetical protein
MSVVFHTPTNKGESMKVSEAIKMLSSINPDEEICISWWGAELFTIGDGINDEPLSADSEEWLKAVAEFEAEEGYAPINEQMWRNLNYAITGQGEF